MLAHDRQVLEVPLEEPLQTHTSALQAWAKTMLPAITQSLRDASTQILTGHQDIRSYFSQATLATTGDTAVTRAVTARPNATLLNIRQRLQSARIRMATISSDIRQHSPGIADGATKVPR
jgi:hypothetical protein